MSKEKAKIRFLVSKKGDDFDFKAGEVYELPLPSCQRWVRRNVASYVDIGDLESANLPHNPAPPAPKYYKGCDGEGSFATATPKVPDIIPLDEADTKKPKAVKRAQSAKNK